ncbi:hypothetical protein V6N13_096369 [Hibiscus sabdariffa]|uniref:Uncharacterized protein n=1 Tax=Hibiscus sabdariffa TaxID=183260 RepID=A0ABR2DFX1_9ROSI
MPCFPPDSELNNVQRILVIKFPANMDVMYSYQFLERESNPSENQSADEVEPTPRLLNSESDNRWRDVLRAAKNTGSCYCPGPLAPVEATRL